MKISEHVLSDLDGTEYFDIFFRISSQIDITLEQYKEIEYLIYKKLYDYRIKVTPKYNSDIEF